MRIDVLTLFPAMFEGPLNESILKRACERGLLEIRLQDLKEYGLGNYRQVDDAPYGGGAGMVMRVDVIVSAIESVCRGAPLGRPACPPKPRRRRAEGIRDKTFVEAVTRTGRPSGAPLQTNVGNPPWSIYLSPTGQRLTQEKVEELTTKDWLLLLCGHYEGIDQRIIDGQWIDEEISIGDYVLTGGELPAMVLIDAVARLLPGVLGKDESAEEESFSKALGRRREYPNYTRPEEFRGLKVPDVLLGGNHAAIAKWRRENLR